MGCGISRFDPKEVVEATTNYPHNPPHSNPKSFYYSTSNCFTGESKPFVQQRPPPPPLDAYHSSPDREAPGDQKMKMDNVNRGEAKEIRDQKTRTHFDDECSNDDDGNDQNCREICRGGSPSFREYCIDSDSRSRSMTSEDGVERDHCKWPPNEKEKGVENEIGKKEGRGKSIRNALQRRKSGGTRNFLSPSRLQQQ